MDVLGQTRSCLVLLIRQHDPVPLVPVTPHAYLVWFRKHCVIMRGGRIWHGCLWPCYFNCRSFESCRMTGVREETQAGRSPIEAAF